MRSSPFEDIRKSAEDSFSSGLYCAESVVLTIAKAHGINSDFIPGIATAFCSGMARSCGPCGALTGGILAIGLVLGRASEMEPVQPAYTATQRLLHEFEKEFGSRNCQSLLDGCDLGTPEGQTMFKELKLAQRCQHITGKAAEIAARVIAENTGGNATHQA